MDSVSADMYIYVHTCMCVSVYIFASVHRKTTGSGQDKMQGVLKW